MCDVEVLSALRRLVLRGELTVERAREALQSYVDLPFTRQGHETLLDRAMELRHNFGAFDAIYVALAETVKATLVTADDHLARAVRRHLDLALIEA